MKKNLTAKRRGKQSLLDRAFDLSKFSEPKYKKVAKDVYKGPFAMYVIGGVGAYILGKFAYKYYKEHPGIGEFLRENVDNIESKLRELRGGDDEEQMARH